MHWSGQCLLSRERIRIKYVYFQNRMALTFRSESSPYPPRQNITLTFLRCPSPPAPASLLPAYLPRCMILSMLFTHGGALAKEISLRVPFSPAPGAHLTTLLHVLLRWLELATSHSTAAPAEIGEIGDPNSGEPKNSADGTASAIGRAAADAGISVMRLLCGWMHDCPAAARELLENPANLFVVDVAAGKCPLLSAGVQGNAIAAQQRVAVKGLACLMLGLLLEYVEDGTGAARSGGGSGGASEWTRALVMKIIQNRVGELIFVL